MCKEVVRKDKNSYEKESVHQTQNNGNTSKKNARGNETAKKGISFEAESEKIVFRKNLRTNFSFFIYDHSLNFLYFLEL